jgi:hypothetical protein
MLAALATRSLLAGLFLFAVLITVCGTLGAIDPQLVAVLVRARRQRRRYDPFKHA